MGSGQSFDSFRSVHRSHGWCRCPSAVPFIFALGLILRVASITLAHALTTMATPTLLFVVGASPQIMTETLYALPAHGVSGGDVHILTTATGKVRWRCLLCSSWSPVSDRPQETLAVQGLWRK